MYGEPPYFAVVEDDGRIVGVAMRTPPHNFILSELDADEGRRRARRTPATPSAALPGIVGPKERAAQFANAWRAATGARHRARDRAAHLRRRPRRRAGPRPGSMRDYERSDRELAIRWMDEFVAEALPEAPPESSAEFVDRREEDPDGGLVIWDDERRRLAGRVRRPHAERHPRRPGLHAAGPARPRLCERAHR